MTTRSESLALDAVVFWDSDADLPPVSSYCAEVLCAPGAPCDRCRLADGLACECCGRPATVIDADLPWCVRCLCVAQVEYSPETVTFLGALVARAALLAPGARVSYRRRGGDRRTFSGVVVAQECDGCTTSVHVVTDGGDLHHVPVACLVDGAARRAALERPTGGERR